MKFRYSKFTGDDLDEVDLEELLSRLSDLMLSSGFDDGYSMPGEDGHSMQSLHDAVMEALLNGGLLSDETLERLLGKDWQTSEDAESKLDELIRRIIEKLQHQGYLTSSPDSERDRERREGGRPGIGGAEQSFKFEITDKSLDFLGYRAARSAGIDRQEQPRTARHARDGDRRRGERGTEAVRVRRHDEPRCQCDDPECGLARPRIGVRPHRRKFLAIGVRPQNWVAANQRRL
jgi:uncharacterized protein with von Willebrand factor type A (vWA) domain